MTTRSSALRASCLEETAGHGVDLILDLGCSQYPVVSYLFNKETYKCITGLFHRMDTWKMIEFYPQSMTSYHVWLLAVAGSHHSLIYM